MIYFVSDAQEGIHLQGLEKVPGGSRYIPGDKKAGYTSGYEAGRKQRCLK